MNYNEYLIVVLTPKITMENYSRKHKKTKQNEKLLQTEKNLIPCIVEIKLIPYA